MINKLKNKTASPGFTLIELLIVMAVMGIAGAMAFNSLFTTKKLYKGNLDKTESLQQIRFTLNSISKDVQNVVRSSSASLKGTDIQIQSKTELHSDTLSLNLFPRKTQYGISGSESFITVKYFPAYDKETGQVTLNKTVSTKNSKSPSQPKELCKNIRGINFRYLKDGVWHNKWDSVNLPDAVEITIVIDTSLHKTLPDKLQTFVSIIS